MTETEKKTARSRWLWSGVLCIFPCSFLFIFGAIELSVTLGLIVNLDRYEKRTMTVDSVHAIASGRSGRVTGYLGYGHIVEGTLTTVDLGSANDSRMEKFIARVEDHDSASVAVFYYPQKNRAFRTKNLSLEQVRSNQWSGANKAIWFVLPLLILLPVFLFHHFKLKRG